MTEKRKRAIVALARSPTLIQAAKEAGVSVATLRRWRRDPEFKTAYRQALDDLIQEAALELRKGMCEAAQTLRSIATDPGAPSSARVGACRILLEAGLKFVETEDILERLERLEDAQID